MCIKMITPIILAAIIAAPVSAQPGPAPGRPTMLIHGNYCGPGNNAPLAPIDALDAACARHDACTPDHGLASKACNLRLQGEAERVASDPRQPEDLRMMAGLVASAAAMMPARLSAPNTAVAAAPGTLVHHAAAPSRSYGVEPEDGAQ